MTDEAPIDTTVPQTARVWNYWLGGKGNHAVDRDLGDQIAREYPIPTGAAVLHNLIGVGRKPA